MEDVLGRGLYWQEWIQNSARKCDIYLRLFDHRVGASPAFMSFGASFSSVEADFARTHAVLMLSYHLRRPFDDWKALVDPSEYDDYNKTLDVSEAVGGSDGARVTERTLRRGTEVLSVERLESQLRSDLNIRERDLMWHRLKSWRRGYFDSGWAWSKFAFEDEHFEIQSERAKASIGQWIITIALVLLGLSVLAQVMSVTTTAIVALSVACVCAMMIVAWAPTFVYIGSKTIVARGAFGIRTLQNVKGREGVLRPRWRMLDKWCGVGAVSVEVPNGRGVFVPFISNIMGLLREAEKPPRPELVRDLPLTEEEQAEVWRRITEFAESLKDDNASTQR
jgi:hypothetical protein